MTPVYPSDEPGEADGRLRGFVMVSVPVLSKFIPE
jgi:hypothetical protein